MKREGSGGFRRDAVAAVSSLEGQDAKRISC